MRQVLTQEFGVDDAFDIEVYVTDLCGRLVLIFLAMVFLEEIVLQYIRNGDEQVCIDAFPGKDIIDGTSRAVDSGSKLGDR